MNTKVTITLPVETVSKIKKLAEENQYYFAQLVRKFVTEGLAAVEKES